MRAGKKLYLLLISVGLVLLAAVAVVLSQSDCVSIRLDVLPHPDGAVSCAWVDSNGITNATPRLPASGGHLSFSIPREASVFGFILSPSSSPYQIKSISFAHVFLFSAPWINLSIAPDNKSLYDGSLYVGSRDTLDIKAPQGADLTYRSFSRLLMKLSKFMPILLVLMILLVYGIFVLVIIFSGNPPNKTISTHQSSFENGSFWGRFLANPRIFYTAIVSLSVLTLPAPVFPIQTGLDPSWVWVINYFALNPNGVGTQLFFTSGPLGFLMHPLPIGHNVMAALVFNLGSNLVFALSIAYLFHTKKNVRPWIWCLLACFIIPPYWEWRWFIPLLLIIMMLSHSPEMKTRSIAVLAGLAGLLTVFVSLIKFSLAICAFLTVFMAAVDLTCRNKRRVIMIGTTFLSSLLIATATAILFLFASPSSLIDWLTTSWEIATGYSTSMPTVVEWHDLAVPILLVSGYIVVVNPLSKMFWTRMANVGIMVPFLFFVFKYSITRCGLPNTCALTYALVWSTAILMVFTAVDAEKKRLFIFFVAFWMFALAIPFAAKIVVAVQMPGSATDSRMSGISLSNLSDTLHIQKSIHQRQQQSKEALSSRALPQKWIQMIGTNTFHPYPTEMVYAVANDLPFVPFPIVQGYSAYTHGLDTRASKLYSSDKAPEYMLCQVFTVDQRNMFLDTPAVWNAIQKNYRFVDTDGTNILLKQTHTHTMPQYNPLSTFQADCGEWIGVPTNRNVYVSIDWPQTATGKIIALALRNTRCSMTIRKSDGTVRSYRITPDTLKTPFPINLIPQNLDELSHIFAPQRTDNTVATEFKFNCDVPLFYNQKIRTHFITSPDMKYETQ